MIQLLQDMERRPSRLPQLHNSPNTAFTRDLLLAFADAEKFAREKGGIVLHSSASSSESIDASSTVSLFSCSSEKSRKQLVNLYTTCIFRSIDKICYIIPDFPDNKIDARVQEKVRCALCSFAKQAEKPIRPDIDSCELVTLLQSIAEAFHQQHSGPDVAHNSLSEWKPEWRTKNLLWALVKKLGSVSPPPGPLVSSYQTLKEAAFECLFTGNYLTEARSKCSFSSTLLQFVPSPGKWDADISWIGTAVFISLPTASFVHSWGEGNRVLAFWGTFVSLFALIGAGLLFFFASYKSAYANALLDHAARGTPFERNKPKLTTESLDTHLSMSLKVPGRTQVVKKDDSSVEESRSSTIREDTETLDIEAPEPQETGSILRLYHASMFVQRIYGSTYIDESWTIGLTEAQLLQAISLVLQKAGALGRQTAAFSFTSLAIASRGVPNADVMKSGPLSAALQSSQVSFALFSFLGALAFTCGMTSAMLSDLIARQMAFTQVKSEGTAHVFVSKFIFFIKATGGLNSCAGMSLFTGVLVFLLSIFRVHPAAVIPLGAAWLISGSLLAESFFTKFHFWNMSEIFEDVGNLIEDPNLQSPSPIAGTLQRMGRWITRSGKGLKKKRPGVKN